MPYQITIHLTRQLYSSNTADAILTVLILTLVGSFILVAIIFLTYLVAMLLERSYFGPAIRALHNDEPRVIAGGAVARDAGLLGMSVEERRMVLEMLLKPEVS